ncbi:MAG: MAPEG family protein [Sphingomonas sp.]
MTPDLTYLAYTAMLTAALWIPYVIAQVKVNGFLTPPNYVDPTPRPLPNWGHRADRTYLNAVETFAPFAALVLVGHATGKGDAITVWTTAFFWLRVAHAAIYLFAIPYLRTLIFTLGFACVAAIFWIVIH